MPVSVFGYVIRLLRYRSPLDDTGLVTVTALLKEEHS